MKRAAATPPERIARAIENLAASAIGSIIHHRSGDTAHAAELEAANFATMLRATVHELGSGMETIGGSS